MRRSTTCSGRVDVLVIGAGQAGLAMGRVLQKLRRDFLVIDGAARVGDSWRARWDSLRLFTPARWSALPDLPFPAPPDHHPGRDEVAGYLESYARTFAMPLALDEPVRELRRLGPHEFLVRSGFACYRARHVVVATGGYQSPRVPSVAGALGPGIEQLHSSAYRSPAALPDGPVLVVGAGNSGVQIAAELAGHREVTLALGTPARSLPARVLGRSLFDWLDAAGAMRVGADSAGARLFGRREFLIGLTPRGLARSHGVRLVPRIVDARARALVTAAGESLAPRTVIWATGFRPSYSWLRAPAFDAAGRPLHVQGLSPIDGLGFLGLPWQRTRGSSLLGWVARDAAHLARTLLAHDAPRAGSERPAKRLQSPIGA
jgi:putative flavoprotein involved in K+ transport